MRPRPSEISPFGRCCAIPFGDDSNLGPAGQTDRQAPLCFLSPVSRHCEAPQGAVAIRNSRPNSRPSSIVPRKPLGDLKGAAAPWPMGRDSKGNRLRDRFPLAVSFPHFFSAKRNGVARRRNAPVLSPSPPQRAIHGPSAHSPLASAICFPVPSPPAAYFLDMEKVGKDTPEGTYFEAVPSGLLPRRPRGSAPLDPRRGFTGDDGRGQKRTGLSFFVLISTG